MALAGGLTSGLRREKFGDDVFEGDVFDRDVGDGAGAENFLRDGDDVFAGDAQGELTVVGAGGGAELRLPGVWKRRAGAGDEGDDFFARAAGGFEAGQRAVVDFCALVDHDDTFTKFLDVGHVVAREENGDAILAVVVAEKLADGALGHDVETDGRFVEKEDARAVEERSDEFHFHPLAEGKLAHHHVEFGADGEKVDEFVEGGFELSFRNAVDGAEEIEGLDGGEIPPELVLLTEDEGEEAAIGVFAFGGIEAGDAGGAARGVDEAREHFERCRLTGAVGAEEADEFALGDGEGDILGGGGFLELAFEQTFHAAPEAGDLFVGAEDAGEVADFDHRGAE